MHKRPIVAGMGMALLLAGTLVPAGQAIAQQASAGAVRTITVGNSAPQEVAAAPGETVELYFTDGTAITLASGARARIGRFTWDPDAKSGVLEFELLSGLARIATGGLDARNGLQLRAGSSEIRLTDAIAIVDLRGAEPTVALWAVGSPAGSAEVSINGEVRRIERPGFAVTMGAGGPSDVRRFSVTASREVAEALNPGLAGGGGGGTSALADATNAEDNARDIREGVQLAAIQVPGDGGGSEGPSTQPRPVQPQSPPVDLGPPARSVHVPIAAGITPSVLASAEPIFDTVTPSINNQNLTRGVASQIVAQGADASLARGKACGQGGTIECDPQSLNNQFTTFTTAAELMEQDRTRGATSSTLIDSRTGAQSESRNQNANKIPPNAVYTFFVTSATTLGIVSPFNPLAGLVAGDPPTPVSAQSSTNPPLGLNGSVVASIWPSQLAHQSGVAWSFEQGTDGLLVMGNVGEIFEPGNSSNQFTGTLFGNGHVSAIQAGFRGFRGGGLLLVDRLPANFLAIQVDELSSGPLLSDCATKPGETCTGAAYFFAAGDVDARPASDRVSIDQFYFTPGLTGYGQTTIAAPTRTFFASDNLPGALGPEDAIGYVITPATGDMARFAHADFIYKVESNRVTGLALGAAIGDFTYTDLSSGPPESVRRQLVPKLGRAVGSSDGNGANAVLYGTNLTVTASGGGNPNLKRVGIDDRATTTQSQGRAGYFVLDAQAPGATTSLLRLAQGISTQGLADLDRTGGSFNGYVAGIAQLSAGQVSWMDLRGSDDFSLAIADGVVAATIAPRTLDETPIGTFAVGGAVESAFVSKDRFIALTPAGSAANLAIVSSDFLGPFQGGPGDPLAAFDAAVPEYARWGAFLGDLTPTPGAQVVAFAPWVAAPRVSQAALPQTGSATYNGAVLGNVAVPSGSQTQTYTAGGTFTHDWSFADRKGSFAMQFDARDYASSTAAAANGFEFNGQLRRGGGAAQVGAVTGTFVSPNPSVAGSVPGGTVGQFSVNEGGAYVAAGVFAGRAP